MIAVVSLLLPAVIFSPNKPAYNSTVSLFAYLQQ